MAFIYCEEGVKGKTRWEIPKDTSVMGRLPECEIHIDNDAVSRRHVRIIKKDDNYYISDVGSRNGTRLDGKEIRPLENGQPVAGPDHLLRDGATFQICEFDFTFHLDDVRPGGRKTTVDTTLPGKTQLGPFLIDEREEADSSSESSTIMSQVDVTSSAGSVHLKASLEARLTALVEITRSLGNSLKFDEVLPKVIDSLFKIFVQADRGFIVLKTESGELVPKWFKVRKGRNDETVRISRTIVNQVMDSKKAILSRNTNQEFEQVSSIADLRIRSMMCAPLLDAEGNAFGVMQIDTWSLTNAFNEEDLDVLASVAMQAGLAINAAQMHESALKQKEIEQDLELAHEVQKAFLPSEKPNIEGYDFFSYYQSANHVGGDYFDYIPLPDGRWAIIVADVVGHGVAAAMMMAKLSAEAKFSLASESHPDVAVTKLNDRLSEIQVDRFVTFVMCVIDPEKDEVTIVNAGHMAPIWKKESGDLAEPSEDISGLPLGIVEGMDYKQVTVKIQPGETMTMFTDGINEAENQAEVEFSIDRIRDHVRKNASDVHVIGKAITEDVQNYIGDLDQFDDMCLVCFGRLPEG